MSFHLHMSYASVANGAVYASVAPAQDDIVPIQNTQAMVPRDMRLLAAYAGGPNLTAARFNSPKLRAVILPELDPFSLTALPDNRPPINRYDDTGPLILQSEQFVWQVSRGGAGANDVFVASWLGDPAAGVRPPGMITIRCTAAIVGVTGAWVAGNMTFPDNLPAGSYDVYGMSVYGTALMAGRLIFPGTQIERPGVLAQGAQGEWDVDWFRRGGFGLFGTFKNSALPQLEIMQSAANTAQTIYMDIVPRVGR